MELAEVMKKLLFMLLLFSGIEVMSGAEVEYHLGPGDILKIEVIGEADFSGTMQVNANGFITMKLVGDIPVGGMTLIQVKDKIAEVLGRDYLLNPQIKVEIVEFKSKKIVVLGEVKKPGEYFLNRDWTTLLEIISLVGGITENAGDKAIIFRKNPESATPEATDRLEISLQQLLGGNTAENAKIMPNDMVNFPSRKTENLERYQVYIEGKVKNPGVYEYTPGLTAYALCMKAGGFLPFAAESRAHVIRTEKGTSTKIKVNIKKIKEGDAPDFPLVPGDKLIIPESWY